MSTRSPQTAAPTALHFLSIDQVATRWGVHPRTVRRMVKSGRLAAVQVGRQYRVSLDVLRQFEQSRAPGSVVTVL